MTMEGDSEVIVGLRGNVQLSLAGYIYSIKNINSVSVNWVCSQRGKFKCQGSLTTSNNPYYSNRTNFKEHSHPPNEMTKEVTRVRKQLREAWLGPDVGSVEALEATLREAPDEVKGQLCNNLSSIQRDIRRQRRLVLKSEDELEIPAESTVTGGHNGELRLESPRVNRAFLPYHSAQGAKKPTPPTPKDIPDLPI